jgi:hypothetical protein
VLSGGNIRVLPHEQQQQQQQGQPGALAPHQHAQRGQPAALPAHVASQQGQPLALPAQVHSTYTQPVGLPAHGQAPYAPPALPGAAPPAPQGQQSQAQPTALPMLGGQGAQQAGGVFPQGNAVVAHHSHVHRLPGAPAPEVAAPPQVTAARAPQPTAVHRLLPVEGDAEGPLTGVMSPVVVPPPGEEIPPARWDDAPLLAGRVVSVGPASVGPTAASASAAPSASAAAPNAVPGPVAVLASEPGGRVEEIPPVGPAVSLVQRAAPEAPVEGFGRLVGVQGSYEFDTFVLVGAVSVGRAPTNTMPMPLDARVGAQQATISLEGTSVMLREGASSCGSYVNGHRVQGPVALEEGDLVALGASVFIFHRA